MHILVALALVSVLASGCARTVDRDEAAICASAATGLAAPARAPSLEVSPVQPDALGRPGLRLTFAPDDPDAGPRWLVCRFADRGPSPDLVALDTPSGPVDETHLVLLRRFWLGSEAATEAAARDGGAPNLPEIPIGVAYPAQQVLNALPNAAVYGLLAAAYALVYGLHGRINLAFGALALVGGLAAAAVGAVARDAPPVVELALAGGLAFCVAALWGSAVERLVLWPLRRTPGQQGLVATVGVALALGEGLRLATGSRPSWVAPVLAEPVRLARAGAFVVTVTPMSLALAAAAAAALLLASFRSTGFGRDWRATADDPLAAALMGVDPRRLSMRTAALASALAGAAGAGLTLHHGGIGFDETTALGTKALIAAILGGIGSVPGAFAAGAGVALTEAVWSSYLPIEHRDLAVDVLLVAALVTRPGGHFGVRDPAARRMP